MELDFRAAIADLGAGAAFRIANAARPPAEYLFNTLLPERNMPGYSIDSGSMTVRATMAGLVGLDSPYPPGGLVEMSTFVEQAAKFANEVALKEQTLRHIQEMLLRLRGNAPQSKEALAQEALNFLQKVIIQPHLDLMEWLRGQALVNGLINWTFNGKTLSVDYGVPAANKLTHRTGTAAYGSTASEFWNDIRALRRLVRGAKFIAHPDTIDEARYNPANAMATVAEGGNTITFRRFVRNTAGETITGAFSQDAGDQVTFILYDREAEVLNPADPSTTIVEPFMPRGSILAVGPNANQGYQPGQGTASELPEQGISLGYTHIAPTVEGGAPGRWADIFTPEFRPWQLNGRGVTNGIPVIEAPTKLARASSDLS